MMMRRKRNIHWNVVRKDGVCCECFKATVLTNKKSKQFCTNSNLADRQSESVNQLLLLLAVKKQKKRKKETGAKGQWRHFAPLAGMIESRLAITSSEKKSRHSEPQPGTAIAASPSCTSANKQNSLIANIAKLRDSTEHMRKSNSRSFFVYAHWCRSQGDAISSKLIKRRSLLPACLFACLPVHLQAGEANKINHIIISSISCYFFVVCLILCRRYKSVWLRIGQFLLLLLLRLSSKTKIKT